MLPFLEFAYSNNYHNSIKMTLYEALCGNRWQTHFVGARMERISW